MDWLLLFAAIGAAAAVLAASPQVRAVIMTIARMPFVIQKMFDEFRPNGGGSLADKIHLTEQLTAANAAKLDVVVAQVRDNYSAAHQLHDRVTELWTYAHTSHHDTVNVLAGMKVSSDLLKVMLQRLHPDPLEMPEDQS